VKNRGGEPEYEGVTNGGTWGQKKKNQILIVASARRINQTGKRKIGKKKQKKNSTTKEKKLYVKKILFVNTRNQRTVASKNRAPAEGKKKEKNSKRRGRRGENVSRRQIGHPKKNQR